MAGLVPAIHDFLLCRKTFWQQDVDARNPPSLARRATAGMSPPKRISAKADKCGHDV
jgi:hypothetical protein